MAPPIPIPLGIPLLFEVIALLVLIVIGLIIIIAVAKVLLFFLPAAIIAIIVWFLTGSWVVAGVAFLIIAVISIAKGR
jgi:hypothetical protein